MKTQLIPVLAIVVLGFSSASTSFGTVASFQGLGDFSGGGFESKAYGVSADGSIVVGYGTTASGQQAFCWEDGTMTYLGDLHGDPATCAYDISADGSVIAGRVNSALDPDSEAFRWEYGSMTGLGVTSSWAPDVSADGSVVVGRAAGYDAFRWEGSTTTTLNPPESSSIAFGVSADGSVIVGDYSWVKIAGHQEALRWEDSTITHLGYLPGFTHSSARAVSDDGSVVVGYSQGTSDWEAFRWTSGTGMVGLADLPGGNFDSWAFAVSADGSVIVGRGTTDLGYESFLWDADNGMRNLKDVLENDCGLDLTDWTLRVATGISADGLTIVGYGTNPEGNSEAWAATIPEPATLLLLSIGAALLRKIRR